MAAHVQLGGEFYSSIREPRGHCAVAARVDHKHLAQIVVMRVEELQSKRRNVRASAFHQAGRRFGQCGVGAIAALKPFSMSITDLTGEGGQHFC